MPGAPHERRIALDIVDNARHLGGLPLVGEGTTVATSVIRAASLHRLTASGINVLREAAIDTVIDLRTDEERASAPTPDLAQFGIRTILAPVFRIDPAPLGVGTETGFTGHAWLYQHLLETGRAAYRLVVETLAEGSGGVLFHCAGGKDRTGIAAMLVQAVAGVTDEAILADHAGSTTAEALAARGSSGAAAEQRVAAPVQAMAATLDLIRERWGSAEGYLREAGASSQALQAACDRMLGAG